MTSDQKIDARWNDFLLKETNKGYYSSLMNFVNEERLNGQIIYPTANSVLSSFEYTPFEHLKVVLLGQDPYHGEGQAHGLSFSVFGRQTIPPSLKNIFKELKNDLNLSIPLHGDLTSWAKQGVLLLNSTMTVRAGLPGSHNKKGWEIFTDSVIQFISDHKTGVVFLLWGKFAQSKESLIDQSKHHILKAPHPSPFSAFSGFFGCKHFSKTNSILKSQGLTPINWSID